jgi:hypothetical protein
MTVVHHTDLLTIRGDQGSSLTLDQPKRDAHGRVGEYRITIEGHGLTASVQVDNHPAGEDPAALFKRMAESWKGWPGELEWWGIEGEFWLTARASTTGHVSIRATLRYLSEDWTSTVLIEVGAGALESLSQRMSAFFACDA